MEQLSHRTKKFVLTLENVPKKCLEDLDVFKSLLESLRETASKKTHYHNLNEWNDKVYDFVHNKLSENGFKNGDPEANDKNPGARFWWHVYGIVGGIHYSKHLKTDVANHHSSAYERNEALIAEIEDVLSYVSPQFELGFCETCLQMTNHLNEVCQKCKKQ